MTEKEQIQYLANIYYLAHADNNFEVDEDYHLIDIAEGISATYLETRKALDMVSAAGESFELIPPERLSDKIRNLEDMMFLAFSDKRLHKMEKTVIMDFARKIDISKSQLSIIKNHAMKKVNQIKK